MNYPRILLADDQQGMIEAVTQLLKGNFKIIGAVKNGEQLIEAETRLDPDLIVLDISMPVMNGIQAALRLRESASRAKLIFLTVHEDPDFVEAAFAAGARGYVLKHCMANDLLPAIRTVLQDQIFVSPTLEVERTIVSSNAY